MEHLAWRYPAEPVERAALRFCEALARWRGKPELETVRSPALPGSKRFSHTHNTYAEQEASADAGPTNAVDARRRYRGWRELRGAPGDRTVLRYPPHFDGSDFDYECRARFGLQ
jgi:hypothetical protein